MSDLVERLRNYIPGENNDCVPLRIKQAADRIEALEAALREIAGQKQTNELDEHEIDCADFENAYDILISRARVALAPEQE